jgi:hypothetical protein
VASVPAVAYAGRLVAAYRAFDSEADRDSLERVLRDTEPGHRLVSLIFERRSRVFQFDP